MIDRENIVVSLDKDGTVQIVFIIPTETGDDHFNVWRSSDPELLVGHICQEYGHGRLTETDADALYWAMNCLGRACGGTGNDSGPWTDGKGEPWTFD